MRVHVYVYVYNVYSSLLDHMFYPDGLELSLFVIRSTHVYNLYMYYLLAII